MCKKNSRISEESEKCQIIWIYKESQECRILKNLKNVKNLKDRNSETRQKTEEFQDLIYLKE